LLNWACWAADIFDGLGVTASLPSEEFDEFDRSNSVRTFTKGSTLETASVEPSKEFEDSMSPKFAISSSSWYDDAEPRNEESSTDCAESLYGTAPVVSETERLLLVDDKRFWLLDDGMFLRTALDNRLICLDIMLPDFGRCFTLKIP